MNSVNITLTAQEFLLVSGAVHLDAQNIEDISDIEIYERLQKKLNDWLPVVLSENPPE